MRGTENLMEFCSLVNAIVSRSPKRDYHSGVLIGQVKRCVLIGQERVFVQRTQAQDYIYIYIDLILHRIPYFGNQSENHICISHFILKFLEYVRQELTRICELGLRKKMDRILL